MASHFDGMSLREIQGMPCTAEATAQHLAAALGPKLPAAASVFSVALAQECYVRRVFLRCPRWRKRKRRLLKGALGYAQRVSDINLDRVVRETRPA
jgi:hypothetical protein